MTRTLDELQDATSDLLRDLAPDWVHRELRQVLDLVAEAFQAGRAARDLEVASGHPAALRTCRYCKAPLIPSGPRPDWAAQPHKDWPFPALFCPNSGDSLQVHEPAEVTR